MLVWFLIASLAVWRFTHMLQDEDGPFAIFARLQAWAARRPDKVGGINQGFFCFYCLSIWVAFLPALAIAWDFSGFIGFILLWFALSASAVLINKLEQ